MAPRPLRTAHVKIRLSPSERTELEALAKLERRTPSDAVRVAVADRLARHRGTAVPGHGAGPPVRRDEGGAGKVRA